MKEIRYRAIDRTDKRMVFGIPFKTELGNWMMRDAGNAVYPIDENTIGQYIGIDDRDGNGIYEGDIIHITDIADPYIVCYASTHARFLFLRQGREGVEEPNDTRAWSYKVIGNIHETK